METTLEEPYIEIRVEGLSPVFLHPPLLDLVSFLDDFNLLYEFSRLAVDAKYSSYIFSPPYSWLRDNRPLADADRLHVVKLRQESPLLLVVVLPAVGAAVTAIWGALQIAQKIESWPIDREKRLLELEKLRLEVGKLRLAPDHLDLVLPREEAFNTLIADRGASQLLEWTLGRLNGSPIRVGHIEVNFHKMLPEEFRSSVVQTLPRSLAPHDSLDSE